MMAVAGSTDINGTEDVAKLMGKRKSCVSYHISRENDNFAYLCCSGEKVEYDPRPPPED